VAGPRALLAGSCSLASLRGVLACPETPSGAYRRTANRSRARWPAPKSLLIVINTI